MSPPQILVAYVNVGSTRSLYRWDLRSQHAAPTTASFLKVPNKAVILLQSFAIYLMAQSGPMNKDRPQESFVIMGYLNLAIAYVKCLFVQFPSLRVKIMIMV